MRRRRDAGFSLIEALIASGLVVAISLGIAQLFTYAIAQNLAARDQLLMGVAAAAKIDELSAAIVAGSAGVTPSDALDRPLAGCTDTIVESGRAYVRRWRIDEVPGYGGSAYAITLRVMPAAGGTDLRLTTMRMGAAP